VSGSINIFGEKKVADKKFWKELKGNCRVKRGLTVNISTGSKDR
jgi:hypothetical protein